MGGRDIWFIGDQPIGMPGAYSMAGHDGTAPEFRNGYADIPPSMFDAQARLAFMDEESIYANVLYPNVGGFGAGTHLIFHKHVGLYAELKFMVLFPSVGFSISPNIGPTFMF